MPINKKESLIYTILMCFTMVLWMSVYNVALHEGGISIQVLQDAWIGFPFAYLFAILLDMFFVSKVAKWFAFSFLVQPTDSDLRKVIAISCCMVILMVLFMSLYGAFEACVKAGTWTMLGGIWLSNIPMNFLMALPVQLVIAGPFVRAIFRRQFPIGTIVE